MPRTSQWARPRARRVNAIPRKRWVWTKEKKVRVEKPPKKALLQHACCTCVKCFGSFFWRARRSHKISLTTVQNWIDTSPKWPKSGVSPWKWPIVWKQKFFQGGPNWKFVAKGVLVMCPVDENCDSKTKNWLLAPNTQIWGHNCTFSSLATNWSLTGQCFQHERGVSLVPWFYSLLLR